MERRQTQRKDRHQSSKELDEVQKPSRKGSFHFGCKSKDNTSKVVTKETRRTKAIGKEDSCGKRGASQQIKLIKTHDQRTTEKRRRTLEKKRDIKAR